MQKNWVILAVNQTKFITSDDETAKCDINNVVSYTKPESRLKFRFIAFLAVMNISGNHPQRRMSRQCQDKATLIETLNERPTQKQKVSSKTLEMLMIIISSCTQVS